MIARRNKVTEEMACGKLHAREILAKVLAVKISGDEGEEP